MADIDALLSIEGSMRVQWSMLRTAQEQLKVLSNGDHVNPLVVGFWTGYIDAAKRSFKDLAYARRALKS